MYVENKQQKTAAFCICHPIIEKATNFKTSWCQNYSQKDSGKKISPKMPTH